MIDPATARHRRKAAIGVALLAALALVLGACGKSKADTAADWLRKGLAAHKAGRLDEAQKDYQEVLKVDSRNKFAFYNLGLIAQTRGDNVTAESDYRLTLSIDPNFGSAIFNLAIVQTALNDRTEAISLYKRVIALEPKNGAAHLNLGLLLLAAGKTKEGRAEIAAAIKLDPTLASRVPTPAPKASTTPKPSP